MPKIVHDKFTTIKDDIERVQKKPTMYISHTGQEATMQLAKEMTNNALDEHMNPNSVSDGHVYVFYDVSNNTMTVEDHGRGIDFEELMNACTVLQSGTKMDRLTGDTAGENGVGLTVTNALSDVFEISSSCNGKMRCLQFRNGKLSSDKTISLRSKDKHGLIVTFQPSDYFLGGDCRLPYEKYLDWLQRLSFFMDKGLVFHVTIDGVPGKAIAIKRDFQNTTGIGGFLPVIMKEADLLPEPITLTNRENIIERDVPIWEKDSSGESVRKLVDFNRFIQIEFSFNYSTESDGRFYSFCNDIENIEGGEHENAVRSGIQAVLLKLVEENQKRNDTIEIIPKDVLTGLCCVLNLRTDMSTKFTSQTKYALGNKAFYAPLRKMVVETLTKYFKLDENRKFVQKLTEIIRTNAKIRVESTKKRSSIRKETMTAMGSKVIVGYTAANHVNKSIGKGREHEELELFMYEGSSAGGGGRKALFNPDIQGVLSMKGNPPNNYGDASLDGPKQRKGQPSKKHDSFFKVFYNDILGCGYGSNYREEDLVYKKIIDAFDADIDGGHIGGLMCANTLKHNPQLILNGHWYRAVAPLYRLTSNKKVKRGEIDTNVYIYSKAELFERFESNASKEIRLKERKDGDFMSSSNMQRFLAINRDYYQILDEMSRFYRIHPDIIEHIVMNIKTFQKKGVMEKLDPELRYNPATQTVIGCYRTAFYTLILDKIVMGKIDKLVKIYEKDDDKAGFYYMYERAGKEFVCSGKKSIGQIMAHCQKFTPDIASRYKGMGEMTDDEMYELVMNPANRTLVQMTIDDMEATVERFNCLFIQNKKHRDIRKDLINERELTLDDIDN